MRTSTRLRIYFARAFANRRVHVRPQLFHSAAFTLESENSMASAVGVCQIIYSNNINGPLKDAINMSDEDFEHMVVEPFARKYDIHFSLSEWRKNLAKAYNLSKKALGMIYRNAMLLMMEPKVEL